MSAQKLFQLSVAVDAAAVAAQPHRVHGRRRPGAVNTTQNARMFLIFLGARAASAPPFSSTDR